MLDSIKLSLRISNTAFDIEILDLIEAAEIDLMISGVNKIDSEDPLIKRAITIYVKAHFGYDHPDASRFEESYINLKQHLSMSIDYNEVI